MSVQARGPAADTSGRSVGRFVLRLALALVSLGVLVVVLVRGHDDRQGRLSPISEGSAKSGAELFAAKGCANCHAARDVVPTGTAPSQVLGELVAAMWNHGGAWSASAPREPERLGCEEMAHLLAFLYRATYADQRGEGRRGSELFEAKGCSGCHSPGAEVAPLRSLARSAEPFTWAAAMWNHESGSASTGSPPRFATREMSDLVAYVAANGDAPPPLIDGDIGLGDADRGSRLFRSKSCTSCHSVHDEDETVGPVLGSSAEPVASVGELAGSLWNHAPGMQDAAQEADVQWPRLSRGEMQDLVAYLFGFHYAEPAGAAQSGASMFENHGCDRCHGETGLGGDVGPRLRSRGDRFTAATLAASLWRHGPSMYRVAAARDVAWRRLEGREIGDLIAFLNTAPVREP